jgi:pimeloyl-ACP methyl ester carboxylesterase/DNA-binding CsgD family transcriptional regulator
MGIAMMPRVQFTRSADGVSIAYSTLGEGPPLVLMPALLFSHLEKMWELAQLRQGLERLAEGWTVVRYDNRGCGLSERELGDFSLEAHLADLEAVTGALGIERFAINGPMHSGLVAVAFAARYPERVTHLVLQSTLARGSDVSAAQAAAMLGLIEADWEVFTETAARVILQWGDEEASRQAAPILRECVTREAARALLTAALQFNVADELPKVKAPTLVIHNKQFPVDLAISREIASRIPNARLAAVESLESVIAEIEAFLRPEEPAPDSAPPEAASPTGDPLGLSAREIEVLRLVAAGKSNRQIADELMIATNTVDRHVSHILAKIGAANRAEAAAYAAKQRLL